MTDNQNPIKQGDLDHIVISTVYGGMNIADRYLEDGPGKVTCENSADDAGFSQVLFKYENQIQTVETQFPMQQAPEIKKTKSPAVAKKGGEKKARRRKLKQDGNTKPVNKGNTV